MNNKVFSLISGVSTLNRAVWRITYLNPLFSLNYNLRYNLCSYYLKRLVFLIEKYQKKISENVF